MRYVKWTLISLVAILVFAFLHYTLPQHDIVRIVGAENRYIDFGENSIFWASPDVGTTASTSRDVRFFDAFYPDGDPMVYRNEDTGWGWPPYFKLDSSNLQAQARDLISSADNPRWVVVTHYGWRNELFSAFPNAVAIRPVEGPDVRIIPWVNIIILTVLLGMFLLLWRMWMQFRERMIDPALERAGDAFEAADAKADEARGRIARWFGSWSRRPPR